MPTASLILTVAIPFAIFVPVCADDASKNWVTPQQLLPADAALVFHSTGTELHQPAISRTAAWKSMVETGMRDHVADLLWAGIARLSPQFAATFRRTVESVGKNGLSFAVVLAADQRVPDCVLVLHNAAERLSDLEAEFLSLDSQLTNRVRETTVDGRQVRLLDVSSFIRDASLVGTRIGWWKEGNHAVIALGMKADQQIIKRVTESARHETTHPLFQSLKPSGSMTVSSVFRLDLQAIRSHFGETPVSRTPQGRLVSLNDVCQQLNVSNLQAITVQKGFQGIASRQICSVQTSPNPDSWVQLIKRKPLSFDDLPPMPAKVSAYAAGRIRLSQAFDQTVQTMDGMSQLFEPPPQLTDTSPWPRFWQVAADLTRDTMSSGLGDVVCVFQDPDAKFSDGEMGVVLAVQVANRKRVEANIRKLIAAAAEFPESVRPSVRESVRSNQTLFTVLLAEQVPVVPAILVSDDWLLISDNTAPLRTAAAIISGQEQGWQPDAESIQALAELPSPASALVWCDPETVVDRMIDFAPLAIAGTHFRTPALPTSVSRATGPAVSMPGWIETLPTKQQMHNHLFPGLMVATVSDTGIQFHGRQSISGLMFGPQESVVILAAAFLNVLFR